MKQYLFVGMCLIYIFSCNSNGKENTFRDYKFKNDLTLVELKRFLIDQKNFSYPPSDEIRFLSNGILIRTVGADELRGAWQIVHDPPFIKLGIPYYESRSNKHTLMNIEYKSYSIKFKEIKRTEKAKPVNYCEIILCVESKFAEPRGNEELLNWKKYFIIYTDIPLPNKKISRPSPAQSPPPPPRRERL
ncbi:MAG TPA: hypothetical protein PKM65_10890 [Spirochaetota bacterium]|nr:hypothetical protein [Spirochaetota bacterium]HNT09304.1 hypothetical protein [Spirochaetota bacterium]